VTRLVQIVPHLPPTISGVGDYALLLAEELRRLHDIHTSFVIGNPDWNGPPELNGFPVFKIAARSATALAELLAQSTRPVVPLSGSPVVPSSRRPVVPLLLHYVGYGYEKRGCPFWLVRGLEAWRSENSPGQLVTMFHELYASGPPWRSSFWSMPLQRSLAAGLAVLSNHCRTNLTQSARTLEQLAPRHRGRIVVQPVFSNVGELDDPPPFTSRQPWLVVFGSGNWINKSFTKDRKELLASCSSLAIQKVLVIGEPGPALAGLPVPIEALGVLRAGAASRWMAQAQAGFTSCPVHCLGKSGIFAAYTAHGLLPVVLRDAENQDDLKVGDTMLTAGSTVSRVAGEQAARISRRAHAWYRPHSLRETASSYAAKLAEWLGSPQAKAAQPLCS
jgi:hypothetical protein